MEIIGKKFNKLLIIAIQDRTMAGQLRCLCLCDCGNKKIIQLAHIKNGHTKSCGCTWRNKMKEVHTKHGLCKRNNENRFHRIWRAMKRRCSNPADKAFRYYGGNGIKVCERWNDFVNFLKDLHVAYLAHVHDFGEHQTTIERIDSKKGYEPNNVRWATWTEQHRNQG
jgi:hypothetical protein